MMQIRGRADNRNIRVNGKPWSTRAAEQALSGKIKLASDAR
jgi:hypothetical protein